MQNAENTGHRFLLVPGAIILLLIGFPFFFFGGPGYHAARSFKEVWNLGHIFFFFPATWLYITFTEKPAWLDQMFRSQPQQTVKIIETPYASGIFSDKYEGRPAGWLFFFKVFFIVFFIGTVIELMQKALGGRTVDPGDVYRDLLGCVTAFIFTGSLPVSRKSWLVLVCGITGLLLIAAWPTFRSLADEQTARSQFPLLADFETPFELARWRNINQIARQKEIVRHGRYGLRVQLSTATYSGIRLFYFPGDWQGYQRLHFSVYNPNNEALLLHCRIHDTLHVQHDMRYNDRFHKRFELHPGWNDLSVSLQEVRTAPATRLMDLTQIASFGIFVVRQKRARVLYLDYIYLSR